MGLWPMRTSLSKRHLLSPALAASLQITTGPSCKWSPTKMTCFADFNIGNKHYGSMAWVASSIKTWLKVSSFNLLSAEAIQVAQITSALERMSFSAALRIFLNFTYSSKVNSAVSSSFAKYSFNLANYGFFIFLTL